MKGSFILTFANQSLSPDGALSLDRTQIDRVLGELFGWQLAEVDAVLRLVRTYIFSDFAQALAFTNRVGELAEAQQHHPALLTEWGKVTVSWWTHSVGGVTRNDLIMAARTDGLHSPGS